MEHSLAGDLINIPDTQGIKYAGSKRKLLPYILNLSNRITGNSKNATVFDGFSGSTRVSQAYAKNGYTVFANDVAPYSRVFSIHHRHWKFYFPHHRHNVL